MIHRCPRCGGARAERRTAKNYRERAALAIFGYHPYRCLECERRFLDRPRARRTHDEAGQATTEPPVLGAPVVRPAPVDERAATLAITTEAKRNAARVRRRPRWVVDAGNSPLARTEVYALVVGAVVLLLVAFVVLRVIWPQATGGVRLGVE